LINLIILRFDSLKIKNRVIAMNEALSVCRVEEAICIDVLIR